jgi:hypothetical protein
VIAGIRLEGRAAFNKTSNDSQALTSPAFAASSGKTKQAQQDLDARKEMRTKEHPSSSPSKVEAIVIPR